MWVVDQESPGVVDGDIEELPELLKLAVWLTQPVTDLVDITDADVHCVGDLLNVDETVIEPELQFDADAERQLLVVQDTVDV